MKQMLLFIAILILGELLGIARDLTRIDRGLKYFKYYSNKDYNDNPQNWAIGQDQQGIIYVANQGGVLQFDGLSWESVEIPNISARSLAIGNDGVVYIGGENQIGKLIPDSTGKLYYKSLVNFISQNQRDFVRAWRVNTAKGGIFFRTGKYLFYWNLASQTMKTWQAKHLFRASFSCKNTYYIHDRKVGLMHVVDDSLRLIPGGEKFTGIKIYMMTPYGDQHLLVGTRENGFFIYDGLNRIPFPTEADDYLKKNKPYHGIRLSSGEFALATTKGGLVIIDGQGRLERIFSKDTGLPDNIVRWVFQDRQGNLWLALNNGIAKIEYNSPFSIYNEQTGLPGLVLSVTRHRDILYTGTSDGLFFLSSDGNFRQIPGVPGMCFSLLSTKHSLLVGTTDGVYRVKGNNAAIKNIFAVPSYFLLRSRVNPRRIWTAGKYGLASFYLKTGNPEPKWEKEHIFYNIKQEIRKIAEDTNGNLWLSPRVKGVLKVKFTTRQKIDTPDLIQYGSAHGLPDGAVRVYTAAAHVIFATEAGIYRFDEKKQHFYPDHTLGKEFAGGVDSPNVFLLKQDKAGRIWFHSRLRNFQAIPRKDGSYHIQSQPFLRIPPAQVNDIFIEVSQDEDFCPETHEINQKLLRGSRGRFSRKEPPGRRRQNTWFASNEGLICFDAAFKKNYAREYPVIIRKVIVSGRTFFNGYHDCSRNPSQDRFPVFPYRDRNLRFEFAAPFFENETATVYRSILQGYDTQWSSWSAETWKNYTNLDAGEYCFKVQAKNVFEHLSKEGVFTFKVLPPWYRTWWAFLLYAAGFLFSVFYAAKWRSLKLEKEKQRLEQIVEERTKEINQKKQLLEKQTGQLKEQSVALQEMDRVKSRFFANISHEFRTPLTLIMGPLEQMLIDSTDDKQKEQVDLMLRNSQRLLTLINQLLDLSRFDSGKVKLKAARENVVPVLKGIVASFQPLTEKNQIQLELNCQAEKICLYFNREQLEEIMYNLLINAIKFTPPGGKITVSITKIFSKGGWHPQPIHGQPDVVLSEASSQKFAEKTKFQELLEKNDESGSPGEFLQVSVRDTGIGIPRDQLAHIFDRFYQAETSGEQTQKGSGIGLALTKELVCLHHGDIDVTSKEGQGTEFLIRLPLGAEHLRPEDVMAPSESKISPTLEGDVASHYLAREIERADEPIGEKEEDTSGKETQKTVILVVEDNLEMRKYIRGALEPGYKVIEAGNGREGIEIAKEVVPDLIVSDIMMPVKDGYQLCHALKNDINTSHIPVILLTAKASEQSIIQGLETGADDYIIKPFNTKILLTRIKNLIELRRQLQLKIQRQKMLLPIEIPISSMDETFLKELQEIVEKNLSDPEFTVDLLCKKLYMGRTNLFKKVEALTGETPKQFIQSYRLERAYRLLKANFGNVTEVAFEVGFSSTAYFTKCFKEKYHCLPSTVLSSEAESK